MAIKYIRERRADGARERHNLTVPSPPDPQAALKRRLLVIYLGLGMASVMLLVFHLTTKDRFSSSREPVVAPAVVVEKRVTEESGNAEYVLVLEITTVEGGTVEGLASVQKSEWDSIRPGDSLTATYVPGTNGGEPSIRSIAMEVPAKSGQDP